MVTQKEIEEELIELEHQDQHLVDNTPEQLLADDEITENEEAFMRGYNEERRIEWQIQGESGEDSSASN